jgi:hypothetical protein
VRANALARDNRPLSEVQGRRGGDRVPSWPSHHRCGSQIRSGTSATPWRSALVVLDWRRDARSPSSMTLRPITAGRGILGRRAEPARALPSSNDSVNTAIGQCDVKRSAVVPCRRPTRLPVAPRGTAIGSNASANTRASNLRIMSTTCCGASRMPTHRHHQKLREPSCFGEFLRIIDRRSAARLETKLSVGLWSNYRDVGIVWSRASRARIRSGSGPSRTTQMSVWHG